MPLLNLCLFVSWFDFVIYLFTYPSHIYFKFSAGLPHRLIFISSNYCLCSTYASSYVLGFRFVTSSGPEECFVLLFSLSLFMSHIAPWPTIWPLLLPPRSQSKNQFLSCYLGAPASLWYWGYLKCNHGGEGKLDMFLVLSHIWVLLPFRACGSRQGVGGLFYSLLFWYKDSAEALASLSVPSQDPISSGQFKVLHLDYWIVHL